MAVAGGPAAELERLRQGAFFLLARKKRTIARRAAMIELVFFCTLRSLFSSFSACVFPIPSSSGARSRRALSAREGGAAFIASSSPHDKETGGAHNSTHLFLVTFFQPRPLLLSSTFFLLLSSPQSSPRRSPCSRGASSRRTLPC